MDVEKPDEKSIMTYVSEFFRAYPETGTPGKVGNLAHESNSEIQKYFFC